MNRVIRIWHRAGFWERVRDSCTVAGSILTGGLVATEVPMYWPLISTIMTLVGALVGIWFNDKDKDGIIDIIQGNGKKH